MNKLLSLCVVLAVVLSSCVSRNYRAVAAMGQSFDCVVTEELMANMLAPSERTCIRETAPLSERPAKVYRVGNEYYVPVVKIDCDKSFGSFPVVGLSGQSGFFVIKRRYCYVKNRREIKGYCRISKADNKRATTWVLDTRSSNSWLTELPAGAQLAHLPQGDRVTSFATCPGVNHHIGAVLAYPLSVATFVAVDFPCAVLGNTIMGLVMGPTVIMEDLFHRRQHAPTPKPKVIQARPVNR